MRFLCLFALLTLATGPLHAQTDDPLAVMLPSGKVLHFQTEDQKENYLAAKKRVASSAATPAVPAASPQPTLSSLSHLDSGDKPAMNGKVNVSAPTFTMDYYMLAPETWVGKQITLSVAYLTLENVAPRPDGMREFRANTYGIQQSNADQRHGGYMTILATPAAATRIAVLCGSRYQYTGAGLKMTLIRGQFALVSRTGSSEQQYGLIVTQ